MGGGDSPQGSRNTGINLLLSTRVWVLLRLELVDVTGNIEGMCELCKHYSNITVNIVKLFKVILTSI